MRCWSRIGRTRPLHAAGRRALGVEASQNADRPAPRPYTPPPISVFPIVYTDEALVVVNKPAGLLSTPGRFGKEDSVAKRAAALFGPCFVVHRLDMDTSGLMVLARTKEAERHLAGQFRERTIEKAYEALVHGKPIPAAGSISLPLIKDWPRRPLQKVCFTKGKEALTEYRTLCKGEREGSWRVALLPRTGRTHQLRVHLSSIGHPIIGDQLYGPSAMLSTGTEAQCDPHPDLDPELNLCLCATTITFRHPVTESLKALTVEAPF
mmetsp:Transcript_16852/g.30984  ORF Transcript_16852/g.30984 Transcript_16852/m.30984 type:complete len:265 (-) Transcript_16852:141-935(-)